MPCASFQRVDLVPVLLPERFRGGCAFGDREVDSLPEQEVDRELVRIRGVDKPDCGF